MKKRYNTLVTLLSVLLLVSACGALGFGKKKEPEQQAPPPQATTPAEEEPECYPGCMFNSDGQCTTESNVMDWASVEREEVPCDPRCCEGKGTGPDGDADGIVDESDECPDQSEDFDGFQDDDGCPEQDNDKDGIADADDVCPLDPEDMDGYQDEDGCPDP